MFTFRYVACLLAVIFAIPHMVWAFSAEPSDFSNRQSFVVPVQIPYEPPPVENYPPPLPATPAPEELTEEDLARAEALLPMLEGRQELYAIAEFVHLGKPVVPIVIKGLTMPGVRIRYNSVETLKIINDPQAVPHLLKAALNKNDLVRIRAHALRTAVRLDPHQSFPAMRTLSDDKKDTIRRTVAFEARKIREQAIGPILIKLMGDSALFVSEAARESFWVITRYSGKSHNWASSTHEQRRAWAQEFTEWWDMNIQRLQEQQKKQQKEQPVS